MAASENLIEELPPASGLGISNRSIEFVADHFRQALKFDPINGDLYDLVESLNGRVEVVDASKREFRSEGTLEVQSKDDWVVYIPEHTSPLDDRFTLAHEIAHFVLHAEMGSKPIRAYRRFDSRDPITDAEREADAFALSFLMPRELVLKEIKGLGNEIDALAATFGVDKNAAQMRVDWISGSQSTRKE